MLYKEIEKKKDNLEELVQATIACRFCGQVAVREVPEDWDEEKRNELATETCDCDAAKHYTFNKQRAERAAGRIELLFGSKHEKPISDDARELLHGAVAPIINGDISKLQLDTDAGIQGKISITSKGSIKVARTDKQKSEYEA